MVAVEPRYRTSHTKIKIVSENTLSFDRKSKKPFYLVFSKTLNGYSTPFAYHSVTSDPRYWNQNTIKKY